MRKERVEATCEAKVVQADTALDKVELRHHGDERPARVAAGPTATRYVGGVVPGESNGAGGQRGQLVRRARAWVANGAVSRLGSGQWRAVPLVHARRGHLATVAEVGGDKKVALGAIACERAATRRGPRHRALQKFEVDVTVAVIDHPLRSEVELWKPVCPRAAHRVHIGELVFDRYRTSGDGVRVQSVVVG